MNEEDRKIQNAIDEGRITTDHAPLAHHHVIINVWNCRAAVARYVNDPPGATWTARTTVEEASNWENLEDEAIEAVEEQGGWVTASGHYKCPPDLAHKATF